MPIKKLEIYKAMIRDKKRRRKAIIELVKDELLTLEGISQYFVDTPEASKFSTLFDLLTKLQDNQTMIFCNTKDRVNSLSEQLREHPQISHIHGDKYQSERDDIFKQFLFGQIRVLITTDLMARGIDIQQVSVVVNYDFPVIKEQYIHRVGRAGRYGRTGLAISLITEAELIKLEDVQNFYNTQIKSINVPELNMLQF